MTSPRLTFTLKIKFEDWSCNSAYLPWSWVILKWCSIAGQRNKSPSAENRLSSSQLYTNLTRVVPLSVEVTPPPNHSVNSRVNNASFPYWKFSKITLKIVPGPASSEVDFVNCFQWGPSLNPAKGHKEFSVRNNFARKLNTGSSKYVTGIYKLQSTGNEQ